jgi:hypothetical protein
VGFVQPQPPFSHELVFEPRQTADESTRKVPVYDGQVLGEVAAVPAESAVIWSGSPSDLIASGQRLSPGAAVTLEQNGQVLAITGDRSDYATQFASEPIIVEPYTDYILIIRVTGSGGTMAIKVLSADMKRALASASVSDVMAAATAAKVGPKAPPGDETSEPVPVEIREVEIHMPFASGSHAKLYIALSNNGQGLGPAVLGISAAKLIAVGPTRGLVTRIPRVAIRSLQKVLFTTSSMLVLIFVGFGFCVLAKRFQSLVLIMAVPFYYLAAQSMLHTEYRYVLGIHYFVFIAAAITLDCGFSFCKDLIRRLASSYRHESPPAHQDNVVAQPGTQD